MKHVQMMNRTRGTLLGTRIGLADRWWLRMRGYLVRPRPVLGEGMLLVPCRAVHMFGVRFALDVLFLDRHGRVVETYPGLQPGGRTSVVREAAYALELPVGTVEVTGTREGDLLSWTPTDGARPIQAELTQKRKRRSRSQRADASINEMSVE